MTRKTPRGRRVLAELLLATVSVFWGGTFPVVKAAVAQVPVLCFLWLRFALSAGLMFWVAWPALGRLDRRTFRRGVLLGTCLFLAYLFQTFGLERTTAANAGFLTGLNVVWVPFLAARLLGKPPSAGGKAGAALAVAGLWLLTGGGLPWQMGLGDLLVVVCSVFVALHIVGLDALTEGSDARVLAFLQVAVMAVWSLLGSAAFEPVTWPRTWSRELVAALVLTAVFATVYAFWIMTAFQRWTTPTRAALIYTLEPVFAAVFSVWLAGERLSASAWTGGALILAGMVLAEAWPGTRPHPSGSHP